MTLFLENETGEDLLFDMEDTARLVCEQALEQEGCPYEVQVNLLLVDNESIRQMNRECRDIDRATDVLSFPNVDFETEGVFDIDEDAEADYFDPDTGELILGDICISLDKVREQAEEYGHSLRREYAFLIAHSMLHLCGYDHMEPEEAARMEAKQEEILQTLGITRD